MTIGITNSVKDSEIKGISSLPQELNKNYFKAPDFTALTDMLQEILVETCVEVRTICDIFSL